MNLLASSTSKHLTKAISILVHGGEAARARPCAKNGCKCFCDGGVRLCRTIGCTYWCCKDRFGMMVQLYVLLLSCRVFTHETTRTLLVSIAHSKSIYSILSKLRSSLLGVQVLVSAHIVSRLPSPDCLPNPHALHVPIDQSYSSRFVEQCRLTSQ